MGHRLYNSCDTGGQKLYDEATEVGTLSLDEKGHCVPATLFSVVILSLQENPNFWNRMLMEPVFKYLLIHLGLQFFFRND
jgi:hypothetical protein